MILQKKFEADPSVFQVVLLKSSCFNKENGELCNFTKKNGVTPDEALNSIIETDGINFLSCGSVYLLIFYRALRDFLGVDKFNSLFNSEKLKFKFTETIPTDLYFLIRPSDINKLNELQLGDKCYFSNIEDYSKKHPYGAVQGYNSIYKEGDRPFLAFGLPTEGVKKEEVEVALFNAYNEQPILSENQSTVTWEEFKNLPAKTPKRVDGKLVLSVMCVDFDSIEALQGMTSQEIEKWIEDSF